MQEYKQGLLIVSAESEKDLPEYFVKQFEVIDLEPGNGNQKEVIPQIESEIIYDAEMQVYYLPFDENNTTRIKPEQTNLLKYMAKEHKHLLNKILKNVYHNYDVLEVGTIEKEQRQPFETDKNQINSAFKPLGVDGLIKNDKKLKKTYYLSRKIKFTNDTKRNTKQKT